ncbi:MAG: CRISPR-associated endoribonuclease Cas6 [Nitrososphaerota archaeon]
MRVCIEFSPSGPVAVPAQYNHAVQGAIYRCLSPDFRSELHDLGFGTSGRRFKLFTFSRLIGEFRRQGPLMIFRGPVRLWVSSPVSRFITELVNGLISAGRISLLGQELPVSSVEVRERPELGAEAVVRTLSPITVYSTLLTPDGRKKTYYYSPFEEEFAELLEANLKRKAGALLGDGATGGVDVSPVGRPREVYCTFKGTVIRGWVGRFVMRGDPRLIEIGYEAGLGAKNSAGFGMVEVVDGD